MKWALFLIVGFLIGFGGAFFFKGGNGAEVTQPQTPSTSVQSGQEGGAGQTDGSTATQTATTGKAEDIFSNKGCLQCHAVEGYGLSGGQVGPDLSVAYEDTHNRFGKSLEDFLNNPEGTMAAVLKQNPLSDDEKKQIVEALKALAEKEKK